MQTYFPPQEMPLFRVINHKLTLLPDGQLSVGLGHKAAGLYTGDDGDFCSRGTLFHVATAERSDAGEGGPLGG